MASRSASLDSEHGRRLVLGVIWMVAVLVVAVPVYGDDWQVEADGDRDREIVERYRTMLEEDPSREMPLERLLGHVGRGQGLEDLIAVYRQRVDDRPEAVNLRLVLGHLKRSRGDYEEAYQHYDRAVELDRDEPTAWISRGRVRLQTGDRRGAMEDFEEGLERETDRQRRRELTRQLGELSFSQREFDRGKEFFERLIDADRRDEHLRMEYIQLLVQYRQLDEAIEQYQAVRPLVAGDPRRKATLLRDKADVYEMMGDHREAVATYEEARELVRSDSWLAREVRDRIVDVHRQAGRLDEFLDEYGDRWRRGTQEQRMAVADVYAEIGRLEEAMEQYQRLIQRGGAAVEPREKLIRVYERLGREEAIPDVYRELIAVVPGDESYGFELAEYYIRSGDREAARDVLDEIRRRFSGDSYVLFDLADQYAQWNFDEPARQVYETVLDRETDDDAVLVDVGDYYFDRGQRRRATEIWAKLPDSQLGRREGTRRWGQLLIERGLLDRGIDVYEELLDEEPDDERLLRSMARALERADRWHEALERWKRLVDETDSEQRRREARARIVELHDRTQELAARMRGWSETFDDEAADEEAIVEAGFYLAEARLHRGDFHGAGEVLTRLEERDELSDARRAIVLRILEQTHVRSGDYREAMETVERMVELRPDDRKELLDRQSDYALQLRADDEAIDYATRALEMNPDNPGAHRRLGDIHRDIGDLEAAVRHYRTVTDIDPRDHDTMLQLGRLLAEHGEDAEANDVLMEVVENATETQVVRDAGEAMLEDADRRDRLAALEARWAPLAFRMPIRQIHADLLFDLYDRMAGPLLLTAYHGGDTDRRQAADRLRELGGRATTLLVEQLRHDAVGPRARALRMIAEMEVAVADTQIGRMIEGEDDEGLRNAAIVTAARIGEEAVVEALTERLDDGSSAVRHLAIWALGFVDTDEARDSLRRVAADDADEMGAQLALLGLIGLEDAPPAEIVVDRLRALAADPAGIERRAAALTLAAAQQIVADGEKEQLRTPLVELARDRRDRVGTWAARVLGTFDDPEAAEVLWELALSDDPTRVRRGETGLVQMLDVAPPVERDWRRDLRFFDWSNGQFDAVPLLVASVRDWSEARPRPADDAWSPAVEQGLVGFVDREDIEARIIAAADRMEDAGRRGSSGRLWNRERSMQFAEAVDAAAPDAALTDDSRGLLAMIQGDTAAMLEQGVDGDDATLRQALRGLSVVGDDDVDAELISGVFVEGLERGDPGLRRLALETLAGSSTAISSGERLAERIVELLDDDDPGVRMAAVRVAGNLELEAAVDRLREIESEAKPALRRAVRQALRSLDIQDTDRR